MACVGWLFWQTGWWHWPPLAELVFVFCLVVSKNSVLSHVESLCGYYGGFVFCWIFSSSSFVIAEIKRHGGKHTLSASPAATLIFRCCCCFIFNDIDNDLILFLTYFNDIVAVLPKIYKRSNLIAGLVSDNDSTLSLFCFYQLYLAFCLLYVYMHVTILCFLFSIFAFVVF